MKHTDQVMKELWQAKDANADHFKNMESYIDHLRKLGKRSRAAVRKSVAPKKPRVHQAQQS